MDSVTGFNDLTPRMGAVYDLFGNGKTALKASAGKYLSAATADGVYSSQNQGLNYVRTASRPWTDSNGDRSRRLQSAESGGAEHQRHGRRHLRGADRRQPELREPRSEYHQGRSGHPERLGRPACTTGTTACRCSTKFVRVCRSMWDTTGAAGATSSSPTTSSPAPATMTCGRCRFRSMPICRTRAGPNRLSPSHRRRRREVLKAS